MVAFLTTLASWLRSLSWPMLKAQWGRQLLALIAIALGVALAYAVHLLNASALAEFSASARALAGTPDLVLRGRAAALPDSALADLLADPQVAQAAPRIEAQASAQGLPRLAVQGLDALQAAVLAPELMPQPFAAPSSSVSGSAALMTMLSPETVFLNDAALAALPKPRPESLTLNWAVNGEPRSAKLRLGGRVAAPGPALAVMDVAAAQALFGKLGRLDRIDIRLQPGVDAQRWRASLPASLQATAPAQGADRMSDMTRAYRVNLGVLSLMALFSGSFLVFAVMSLGVTRRLPQLALLGVLGLGARERQALVLAEAALLGLLGSALGLALGAGLAALGLRLLGGDLGSGLLAGATPHLQLEPGGLLLFGLLGFAVALASAWLPARLAGSIAPAQVLKGLGNEAQPRAPAWLAPALLVLGALLAFMPPLFDLPIAAYLGMLCLLVAGLLAVPPLVRSLLRLIPGQQAPLRLLLTRRAHDQAGEAAQMIAGVLVALALSVAMLVMVSSFRDSLQQWLRQVLPADLYVRSALREPDGQSSPLPVSLLDALRQQSAVQTLTPQRSRSAQIGDEKVALMARDIAQEDALPLVGHLAPAPAADRLPVYINEALRDQLRLQPGMPLTLTLAGQSGAAAPALQVQAFVRGVWRDYARQSGALQMSLSEYQRLTGDRQITELYLWLAPGATQEQLQQRVRALAGGDALEFAASAELLAISLHIFDRSFAVTYWLQAIALGLGLVGVAASLSAQLLARRREMGLLHHLGLSRSELLRLLLGETALYTGAGALAGLGLGLLISGVLVYVVNPQSFHWSMELSLPLGRLTLLLAAVLLAALLTAALVGRQMGRDDAVRSVREDW
jgi:putative ABC transport system permease protein